MGNRHLLSRVGAVGFGLMLALGFFSQVLAIGPLTFPGGDETGAGASPGTEQQVPDRGTPQGGRIVISGRKDPTPAPEPEKEPDTPSPQTADVEKFLVGLWKGQQRSGPLTNVTSRLKADHTYHSIYVVQQTGLTTEVWGRWSVSSVEKGRGTITAEPDGWRPQQVCGRGGCVPVEFNETTVAFRIIDANTISLKRLILRRSPG